MGITPLKRPKRNHTDIAPSFNIVWRRLEGMYWQKHRTSRDHEVRPTDLPYLRDGMGSRLSGVGDLLCVVLQAERPRLQMEIEDKFETGRYYMRT